jgi:diphthamide synthase (EF-2-diphthine--ammonia ligase)
MKQQQRQNKKEVNSIQVHKCHNNSYYIGCTYNTILRFQDELLVEAVSVGAILSDYQRVRVEHV